MRLLWSRSSAIESFTPLPFGSETCAFAPSPITKMFDNLGLNQH
jgi:hypothetical protein